MSESTNTEGLWRLLSESLVRDGADGYWVSIIEDVFIASNLDIPSIPLTPHSLAEWFLNEAIAFEQTGDDKERLRDRLFNAIVTITAFVGSPISTTIVLPMPRRMLSGDKGVGDAIKR